MAQLLLALGFALAAGVLGALIGPHLVQGPGMGGLFAGLGFAAAFMGIWRGLGGTCRDLRDLFA
jgi:hypothetical protein